ncbi:MAG: PEGA domain-containing protein [Patescibacteria group bacterium]|nr:PEGA domain-containing protein [Patescibacteria group bacterium]
MTLTHRRLLYLVFFLIFFASAPIVLKLAEGYKFDWRQFGWQKAGVLFLESKPEKATVYLNSEKTSYQTTTRIKTLLPGEYQVEIKKDGYLSWSKKLKINAGETTFAQYIRLFKENINAEKILADKISAVSEMAENKIAIATNKNTGAELFLLNLKNDSLKKITLINFTPESLILDSNGTHFLLKNNGAWRLLTQDIFGADKTYQLPASQSSRQKIAFDPDNSLMVYALSNLGLEKIDVTANQALFITTGKIADFYLPLGENNIYYLKNTNTQTELLITSKNGSGSEAVAANLPLSSAYNFFPAPPGIVNIIDKEKNKLYIFDIKQKIFSEKNLVIDDVNKISWYNNSAPLIYGNDNEIWTYEGLVEDNRKQLIARLGTKIENFWWYGVPTHLLYLTSDGLFITELITNNFARDTINLPALKTAKQIWLTEKGDKIYWLNDEQNFFVSQIQ